MPAGRYIESRAYLSRSYIASIENFVQKAMTERAALLDPGSLRSHVLLDESEERIIEKCAATPQGTPRQLSGDAALVEAEAAAGVVRLAKPISNLLEDVSDSRPGAVAGLESTARTSPELNGNSRPSILDSLVGGCTRCWRNFCSSSRDQCARLVDLRLENTTRLADSILTAWIRVPSEVLGLCMLLPILDPVSDLAVFNQLLSRSFYGYAVAVLVVLLLHWRFCMLYAALTPVATYGGALALYLPGLLLPYWGRVVGEEISEADLRRAYAEADAMDATDAVSFASKSPHRPQRDFLPSHSASSAAPTTVEPPPPAHHSLDTRSGRARKRAPGTMERMPRYGTEAGRVRAFLQRSERSFARPQRSISGRACAIIGFEAKVVGLSLVLGPFQLWRAALTLAHNAVVPAAAVEEEFSVWKMGTPRASGSEHHRPAQADAEATATEQHLLHCRVLTLLEAVCESWPQMVLQTAIFMLGDQGTLHINLYLFSVAASLGVMSVGLISFAAHRQTYRHLLNPPRSEFVAQVHAIASASHVDGAALLAAIAAAREAGVPSEALRTFTLALREHRVANARLQTAEASCTPAVLMCAGYTTAEMYAAGLCASELKEAGFNLAELEAAGCSLAELNEAEFNALDMHAAGHGLSQLKRAGYMAAEVMALRAYSITELRQVGYTAHELKAAACEVEEMHAAGYTLEELKQIGSSVTELIRVGYEPSDLRQVGFTAAELRAARCGPLELRAAGYALCDDTEFSVRECKEARYSAVELRVAGHSSLSELIGHFSAFELREAGFALAELAATNFSPEALHAAGYSASEMRREGFEAGDLRLGGFNVAEVRQAGFSTADMRVAGYTVQELRAAGLSSGAQLKAAGFTASELRAAGCSAPHTKAAGYALPELKTAGFTPTELRPVGFRLGDFKSVGYPLHQLREAGFTSIQLRNHGYMAAEQKAAGYTAHELKDAGCTAAELKAAGFSASELRGASCSASELRIALYTPVQLRLAGLSASQMKEAGYSKSVLKAANYSDEEILAAYGATTPQAAVSTALVLSGAVSSRGKSPSRSSPMPSHRSGPGGSRAATADYAIVRC